MKRPTKPVYRKHDIVEIVEPMIFQRVGYPLSLADGIAHIEETYSNEIRELLVKTGIEKRADSDADWLMPVDGDWKSGTFGEISKALAYRWVAMQNFGGSERTIHTKLDESLRGKMCRVHSKRNVKTGTYYAPSGGYSSYYGEWESEPGGLGNCETHVILEVHLSDTFEESFEIEARHVKHHLEQVPGGVLSLHAH